MEYSFYDFLKLIGSLALFLYGMKIMSEGLQKFAGDRLAKYSDRNDNQQGDRSLTGVLITALIQSSSATTVMVVSFVNAGLLTLSQSIRCHNGCQYRYYCYCLDYFNFRFKVDMAAFALPLLSHCHSSHLLSAKATASPSVNLFSVFLSFSWGFLI